MENIPEDRRAPEGHIWVCCACGKTSDEDLYGDVGKRSYGWDMSCILKAKPFRRDLLVYEGSRVVHVKDAA